MTSKKPNVSGHWSGQWGSRVSLVSLIKQAIQMRGKLFEMRVLADSTG